MTRAEINNEWNHIVSFGAIDVMNLKELEDIPEIADEFYRIIVSIFTMMSKLKHDKFYNNKELDTVFTLVKPDIYSINDLLIELNDKALPSLIYEIIFNIFEELCLFVEDFEMFETAQNILNFRSIWFAQMGVQIIKLKSEKK